MHSINSCGKQQKGVCQNDTPPSFGGLDAVEQPMVDWPYGEV